MSRELDFGSAFFKDEVSSQLPQPPTSDQHAAWSDAHFSARRSWHKGEAGPFVYAPARGSSGASPWFGEAHAQPASTQASDALHSFFDGWINTLASWTQSGSATIGPHHDPFQGGFLASGGGSEPTHGGWGSSSR